MGGRLSRTPKNIPKTTKPVKPAKPVEFSDINPDYKPGDGFRSMGGSQAFRALNFELYVQEKFKNFLNIFLKIFNMR